MTRIEVDVDRMHLKKVRFIGFNYPKMLSATLLKTVSEARANLMSKTSKDAADEAQLVSLAEQRADLEIALGSYQPQVDLSD